MLPLTQVGPVASQSNPSCACGAVCLQTCITEENNPMGNTLLPPECVFDCQGFTALAGKQMQGTLKFPSYEVCNWLYDVRWGISNSTMPCTSDCFKTDDVIEMNYYAERCMSIGACMRPRTLEKTASRAERGRVFAARAHQYTRFSRRSHLLPYPRPRCCSRLTLLVKHLARVDP
jgi:hypothetical protein